MSLPESNPRIPEGINASQANPLLEFAWLAGGILVGLALVGLLLSFSVRLFAPYIPFAWEQRANGIVDGYVTSEESCQQFAAAGEALEALAAALLATSLDVPLPHGEDIQAVPRDAYRFHLLDDPAPNAFATLGANVMVTRGLLEQVQSENGLAMVIAHEIAHVQLRHPVESLSRGLAIQLVISGALGLADNSALGGALSSGSMLTMLSFSRDMEREADERALAVLRAH